MNTENKVYNINYTENEDMNGGMYFFRGSRRKTLGRNVGKAKDVAKQAATKAGDAIYDSGAYVSNLNEKRAAADIVNDTLGGTTLKMGVKCTTIPILIEHLIRKYLLTQRCTNNKEYNYDFITGGRDGFQDAKFRDIIHNKMLNWLSNTTNEPPENKDYVEYDTSNPYKQIKADIDERLVIGGGLYNLQIAKVKNITNTGGYLDEDSKNGWYELLKYDKNRLDMELKNGNYNNNNNNTITKGEIFFYMNDYYELNGLYTGGESYYTDEETKQLKSRMSILMDIVDKKGNVFNSRPIINEDEKKKYTTKANLRAKQKNNIKIGRERIKLRSIRTSYKINECNDLGGDWDGNACYERTGQSEEEEVPLRQMPIQQIPIQQMPVQQVPVQQMAPVQQVQMIPVQMGGISDENDYLVKKQLGSKGFKKLKNGIKKLFDEFNESEQVNILKEKDNNLLEYMIWNYGLKQNN